MTQCHCEERRDSTEILSLRPLSEHDSKRPWHVPILRGYFPSCVQNPQDCAADPIVVVGRGLPRSSRFAADLRGLPCPVLVVACRERLEYVNAVADCWRKMPNVRPAVLRVLLLIVAKRECVRFRARVSNPTSTRRVECPVLNEQCDFSKRTNRRVSALGRGLGPSRARKRINGCKIE